LCRESPRTGSKPPKRRISVLIRIDSERMAFGWGGIWPVAPGWSRIQRICDFVHEQIGFDYWPARSNRTALRAFREGVGVCRDFTHLCNYVCRCPNISTPLCNRLPQQYCVSPSITPWTRPSPEADCSLKLLGGLVEVQRRQHKVLGGFSREPILASFVTQTITST
jgi:transglutaminase superfamily protein